MATSTLPPSLSSQNPFRPSQSVSNPWFDNTRQATTSSPPPIMTPEFPPTFIHINAPPAVRPYYPGAHYIDDTGNVVSPPTTRPVVAHQLVIDDNGNFVPMEDLHARMPRSGRLPWTGTRGLANLAAATIPLRTTTPLPAPAAQGLANLVAAHAPVMEEAKLNLNKANYRTWSKTLWNNIAMNSGATRYLDPMEEPPSEARYPRAYRTWRSTNCTFNATHPVIAGVNVAILPDCHRLS
ncbi:hypothetical protein B0H14DRAFT_3505319 [Mycena olivaceomarginata]|nr:hypothetical protein B0H14DRAFT_3505319 [Mycena olivaceomarginata]